MMAKVVLKRLSEAQDTDIICQTQLKGYHIEALGYLRDWFVSGKKVHVRVRNLKTGEIIPMSLDTPSEPQAWFIVNDKDEKG